MRTLTAGAAVAVIALVAIGGYVGVVGLDGGDGLEARWVSDTGIDGTVNHHATAAGAGLVFAPISATGGSDDCRLAALAATDGAVRWSQPVPAPRCTIHAVATPTVADADADGEPEVLVATTEAALLVLDAASGTLERRHPLSAYGYARPVVADLLGDDTPEVTVVDVRGAITVLSADGSVAWERAAGTYTWGQPRVADLDGDGDAELVVGFGETGRLVAFEGNGTVAWERTLATDGAITWLATGGADGGDRTDVVVATADGTVVAVDGRDGTLRWRRGLGTLAAVHAVGDGDRDGAVEVYATAADAELRAFTLADGTREWSTALAAEGSQMTPPPALGDLDGDGTPELVAVTNTGVVQLVDPVTGELGRAFRRDVPIWTTPTVADTDADGVDEVYVIYGDGRVAALAVPSADGSGPSG